MCFAYISSCYKVLTDVFFTLCTCVNVNIQKYPLILSTQTAKAIRYQSHIKVSHRYVINFDPIVLYFGYGPSIFNWVAVIQQGWEGTRIVTLAMVTRGHALLPSSYLLDQSWIFNSLWPSYTIWWHRSGTTLAHIMAWCWTPPPLPSELSLQTPRNTPVLGHLPIKRYSNR